MHERLFSPDKAAYTRNNFNECTAHCLREVKNVIFVTKSWIQI